TGADDRPDPHEDQVDRTEHLLQSAGRAGAGDHVVEILGSEKTHCVLQILVDRPRDLIILRVRRALFTRTPMSPLGHEPATEPVCKNNAGQKQLWRHIITIPLSRIKGITQKIKSRSRELFKNSINRAAAASLAA